VLAVAGVARAKPGPLAVFEVQPYWCWKGGNQAARCFVLIDVRFRPLRNWAPFESLVGGGGFGGRWL
jgi:hypothetical protein